MLGIIIKKTLIRGSALLLLSLSLNASAADNPLSWNDFIANLRTEALAENIRPEVFDQAFANVHAPSIKVLHLDKTQPEKRLSYLEYRNSRIDPYRIQLGRQQYERKQAVLNKINSQYGVSPCFILSIWGLETSYGHFKGNFPVIQSLATLAYNPRRGAFFHKELLTALHMLNDGSVRLEDFKGEWAGASGHCQFMPSAWKKYGVSYSGQGTADIWNNTDDALASIANYLQKNGWHPDQPWAIEVSLPAGIDPALLSINVTKPVKEWLALGVKTASGYFPDKSWQASLINPDGGPAYMVFDNFKTLRKWNRSNYYVGSLGYLAEEICQRNL